MYCVDKNRKHSQYIDMEQAIQEVQLNPPIYVFEFDVYLKHLFHAPHLFHACTLRRHLWNGQNNRSATQSYATG